MFFEDMPLLVTVGAVSKCKFDVVLAQISLVLLLTKHLSTSIIAVVSPSLTQLLQQSCSGRTARPRSSVLMADSRNHNA